MNRFKFLIPAVLYFLIPLHLIRAQELSPSALVESGNELAKIGLLDEAIEQFREALKIDPENYPAQLNIGYCYVQKQEYEKALPYYERAAMGQPLNPVGLYQFAIALEKVDRMDEAIANYKLTIRLDEKHTAGYVNLIYALLNVGNYDEAIEYGKTITEIEPDLSKAHELLGISYQYARQDSSAEQSFQQALTLDPANISAQNNYGSFLIQIGQYLKAVEHYETLLGHHGEFRPAYVNVAVAYQRSGRYADAAWYFETALRMQPDDPESLLGLGICMTHLDSMSKAINIYQKALEINPDFNEVKLNLANTYRNIKEYTQAQRLYDSLLEHGFHYAEVYLNYAILYRQMGQEEESQKMRQKSEGKVMMQARSDLWVQPDSSRIAVYNLTERISYYLRLIEEKPEKADNYFLIGRIYETAGNIEMALQYYRQYQESGDDQYPVAQRLQNLQR